MHGLAAHGLWFDETLSVSSACGSILQRPFGHGPAFTPADFWAGNSVAGVVEADVAQDGGNGIVYHLLLHAWVQLAGTSDFAVRLPSLLAGVLAVAGTHALALRLANPGVAWWATFLAAAHPLLIRLSQEARSYSLATALGVLSTLLLVRWLEGQGRTRHLVAYALSATALVLTHYLATAVLIAHAAFVLLGPVPQRRRLPVVGALMGAALLAALWLPLGGGRGLEVVGARDRDYRARAMRSPDRFAQGAGARTVGAGIVQMTAALSGDTLQDWGIHLSRISTVLVVPGVLIAAAWRRRTSGEGAPSAVGLLTVLSVASVAVAGILALISGHVVSFQPRYAAFVAPYAMILLAVGITAGGTVTRVALAGHLAVVMASVLSVYADAPVHRPRNAFPTRAAAALGAREGTVVHRNWPEARMVNLYLPAGPTPPQRVRGPAAPR